MTRRRVALALASLSSGLLAAGYLSAAVGVAPDGVRLDGLLITVAFIALGGLLAVRRPDNPIGWLFGVAGLSAALLSLANHVSVDTTGTAVLAVLGLWGLIGVAGIVTMALTQSFMLFEQAGVGASVENPLAIPDLAGALESIFLGGAAAFFASLCGAVVSLFLRYRRGAPDQRQQLKWVALAATAALLLVAFGGALVQLPLITPAVVTETALLLIPASVTVAVLRFRLYEIDRVVSRTVTYILTPVRRRVQALVDRRFNRARYDAQRTVESFASQLREPASVRLWLRGAS